MHFRHISAKIQLKNWNNISIEGGGERTPGPLWLRPWSAASAFVSFRYLKSYKSNFLLSVPKIAV